MLHSAIRQTAWSGDTFRRSGRTQLYGAALVRLGLLLDAAALYVTLYVAVHSLKLEWSQRYVTLALLAVLVFSLISSFRPLHHSWRLQPFARAFFELFCLLTASFVVVVATISAATTWAEEHRHVLLLLSWWALALLVIAGRLAVLRLALLFWRAGPSGQRAVAFYGDTEAARHLMAQFQQHPWMGLDVEGVYEDEDNARGALRSTISGGLETLVRHVKDGRISAVYLTKPIGDDRRVKEIIEHFADTTVTVHYCPPVLELDPLGARWDDVFGLPVITIVASPFDEFKRHLKRLEDLALCAVVLPLIAIPCLAVAAAIKLTSRGPVLYLQSRNGVDGRPFRILKFRTMYTMDRDDEFVQARTNDARITPVGAFLRRTSIDELPQFINVLRGDMSVVGPRPAPLKYNAEQRRVVYRYMLRHKVKPGITGLAQVNGCRGETDSVDKIVRRTAYDLEYIGSWSLWLDLKILTLTALQILRDIARR